MVPWPPHLTALLVFSATQSYASTGGNSILYEYFNEWLDASDNMATFACSTVIVLNNVFGVIGALWADWRIGVYLIQIWTSIVWGIGSALIAFSAVGHSLKDEGRLSLGLIGVLLTCIGSGVQGPTQSKFLGDQTSGDYRQYSSFFSWYYLSLNIGALAGESVCPLLRAHVSYFVAFLSVFAAQIVALLAFAAGSRRFVRDDPKPLPPEASQQCCVVYHVSQYTRQDWADVKRILVVFIGLPIYWALYYQQNSTWVNQANQMNTDIIWNTPDVMASSEDLMVCILVPSFEVYLYPWLVRCFGSFRPLKKIVWGMIFGAGAFVLAAMVQLAIDHSSKPINVAYQLPQYFFIAVSETMVSVTGLEFAYAECGPHLRNVVQALWALMQLGQLLTGALALGEVKAYKGYFICAGLMYLFIGIFMFLVRNYKYQTPDVGATPSATADSETALETSALLQEISGEAEMLLLEDVATKKL